MYQETSINITQKQTLREDFESIRSPTGHLTCRIIDFQMDMILSQISEEIRDQTFVFDSDAFSNLKTYKKESATVTETLAKLEGALERKILVIPCNSGGHWFLATVVKGEEIIRFFNSMSSQQRCNMAYVCLVLVALRQLLVMLSSE